MRTDDQLADFLRSEIATGIRDGIGQQLDDLRRFVDRRMAELSAELNATATLSEMSEASITAQIAHVQQEVARMVSVPVGDTRTSGMELEAVVQGTEVAANQIMEAAEAILDWLAKGANSEAAQEIGEKVQSIFEACSFQDLTSQRIRRAIRHLQEVDTMLTTIASPDAPAPAQPAATVVPVAGPELDQDLIDQLMNG